MAFTSLHFVFYGERPTVEARISDGAVRVTIKEGDSDVCFSGSVERVTSVLQRALYEVQRAAILGEIPDSRQWPAFDFSKLPGLPMPLREDEGDEPPPSAIIVDAEVHS